MSLLFDFSKINIVPHIGTEIDTKGNIKEFNKNITTYNIINKFVLELNNKLTDIRNKNIRNQDIFFEIEFEREQHIETHNSISNSISAKGGPKLFIPDIEREQLFYLRLNIDGHLLNIFSAKAKNHSNGRITFEDIKWQYNLSQEFMNYVYDNCILQQTNHPNLFYDIMLIYYQVVEKQIQDFVSNYNHYNAHNKIRQYIFFYNVYVERKIFENVLLLDKFKNNEFINFYDTNCYEIFFLLIDKNIFKKSTELNIIMDLYFFFIFFVFFKDNVIFDIEGILTIEILKKYMLHNLYNFKLTKKQENLQEREMLGYRYIIKQKNLLNNIITTKSINNYIFSKKIKNIENKKSNNENVNFIFLLKYMSVYSNYDGFISFINDCINLYLNSYQNIKSGNSKKERYIIDFEKKTLFLKESGQLKGNLFLEEYRSTKVTKKAFVDTLDGKTVNSEKIFDNNFLIDYKNRFVTIKINFELKAYIIKLWTKYVIQNIVLSDLLKLINFFLKIESTENYEKILIKDTIEDLSGDTLMNIIQELIEEQKNIKNINENDDMLIISYNEGKKEFSGTDCIGIITKILITLPSIIVIGTQESGTSFKKSIKNFGEATHYIHVLGEKLKEIGYKLLEKDRGHSIKLKTDNVRMRVYYLDKVVGIGENNDRSIKIIDNKMNTNRISLTSFGKGAVFSELCIRKNNENRNFIFMNADFSYGKNSNNDVKEKFIKLVNKKLFGGNESLVDFYKRQYNIIVFGDLKFDIALKRNESNKFTQPFINTNINRLKKIFSISLTTQSQILSILPQITSDKIYQTYDYPIKSSKNMTSLTFSLYGNNNQEIFSSSSSAAGKP